jgi:hypothetical protein
MKLRTASVCLLTTCFFALSAFAQNDLYNDGPTNGNVDAWAITGGFAISDSFTLAGNSTVKGLNFAAWIFPGDLMESAQVSFTSNEFGGTTYFDQQVNFSQSGCSSPNQYGYDVCNELGSFSEVALNAGTYWLTLQNAVVNDGDPVYWDENGGPSSASNNSVGTLQGESFTVLGSAGSGTGTTPEPESILLFGSGVFGIGALLRRKPF